MASNVVSSVRWLASKLTEAIGRGTSADQHRAVEADLKRLNRLLVRIQAVLQDAEQREIHDVSVKLWLSELRGVAYRAEDVLDEYHYEVLRSIVESRNNTADQASHDQGTKRKLKEILESSSHTEGSSSSVVAKITIPDGMSDQVKEIIEQFDNIAKDRDALHLRKEDGVQRYTNPQKRPPTSSHVDESVICDREKEKDEVIKMLVSESNSNYHIVSIVGKGGLGKTTLAQLVYKDSWVQKSFDLTAWVSVSEDFDPVRLTKATIESVTKKPCSFSELNELQDALKKTLKGKKLFLVLDDVWNEEKRLWDSYRVVFVGAKDVRILLTTRNMGVAKIVQSYLHIQLDGLPDDQSWKLFLYYAFGTWDSIEQKNLLEIGRGIVKKCKGLPLAIKALGGFLGYETNVEKWREVLESNIWELDEERNDILPTLRLSYQHLPLHLRPCFLYLSIFPKDQTFRKDMVVRLWMAQGYITTRPNKSLEDLGSEYFEELQSRSLIDFSYGRHLLHDLIHDLARSISENTGFNFKNEMAPDCQYRVYHIYHVGDKQLLDWVPPSTPMSVRTLLTREFLYDNFIDTSFLSKVIYLRVLALNGTKIDNLPACHMLKHLRYLKLRLSESANVLESICLLYNLQTLELECDHSNYSKLQFPSSIGNLFNLRYLHLHNDNDIESSLSVPQKIGALTNLQDLDMPFNVKIDDVRRALGEFKYMVNLRGHLMLSGLNNIADANDAKEINLIAKPNLQNLILYFDNSFKSYYVHERTMIEITSSNKGQLVDNMDERNEAILENLRPHNHVKNLTIGVYAGKNIPSWMSNSPAMPYLVTLTLNRCFTKESSVLPPLGQLPSLKFLYIRSSGVFKVGDEFRRNIAHENACSMESHKVAFPSLEILEFTDMYNWVEWFGVLDGDFPRLRHLYLESCPELWKLPTIPKKVTMLKLIECGCHKIQFSSESIIERVSPSNCPKLSSIDFEDGDFPFLKELKVEECPQLSKTLTIPKAVKTVTIRLCDISEIQFSSESIIERVSLSNCPKLSSIDFEDGDFPFLKKLKVEECPQLSKTLTIPKAVKKVMIRLCDISEIQFSSESIIERVSLSNCPKLSSIDFKDGDFPFLKELKVEECPQLSKTLTISKAAKTVTIRLCDISEIQFSSESIIERVSLSNCPKLSSIDFEDGDFPFLKELKVEECPRLSKTLTIPKAVKTVTIRECDISEIQLSPQTELSSMVISDCLQITTVLGIGGLTSLEKICLQRCPLLSLSCHHKLHSMTRRLHISNYPRAGTRTIKNDFVPFLGDSTCEKLTISSDKIFFCDQDSIVVTLPESYIALFFSLDVLLEDGASRNLFVHRQSCQQLPLWFPMLVELTVVLCTKIVVLDGLNNLGNLKHLKFWSCLELSFINIDCSVPSLERLELWYCYKLSFLPRLDMCSGLKVLDIKNCPNLTTLIGMESLHCLETLEIMNCRSLCIHPVVKLQRRFRDVDIRNCPRLLDWCQINDIPYNQSSYPSEVEGSTSRTADTEELENNCQL